MTEMTDGQESQSYSSNIPISGLTQIVELAFLIGLLNSLLGVL